MALRTVSNTGGNWNATTSWVGGVIPIAGDTVNFTATSGNLTVNISTAALTGIDFTNYIGTITFNNQINTSGSINLGSGGYTQSGSFGLSIVNTSNITSNGVTWSRTLTFNNTSFTVILNDNLYVTGNVLFQTGFTFTINGNSLYVGSNLTISTANTTVSGTTNIIFNGNGTWSHTAIGYITNNITINTSGTLTIGSNIYYRTGTLTYIQGTVNTTTNNSTLTINNATTLDTNGINWNNVTISIISATITIGLTSDFNITNTLTLSGVNSTLNFSGAGILNPTNNLILSASTIVFTINLSNTLNVVNLTLSITTTSLTINNNSINVNGNLSTTGTTGNSQGTTNIILVGTGTWSNTSTSVYIKNTLNFNTIGIITISGNVYFGGGTMTYIQGTINTYGGVLNMPNTTGTILDVSNIYWNNVVQDGTVTLLNDFNINNISISNTINGFNVNVNGDLIVRANISGTSTINLLGNGTWSSVSTSIMINDLNINTSGNITISGNIYYRSGTLTYINGKIITKNSTLNLTNACTLINCNKINFNNVVITAGITVTMNEFFSGSPTLKTNIISTSTSNYTITFQDNFEKIAKFVELSNCTMTRKNQLLMLTNIPNKKTNIGIRYINNLPNSVPKNEPSVNQSMTYGTSFLTSDPCFN